MLPPSDDPSCRLHADSVCPLFACHVVLSPFRMILLVLSECLCTKCISVGVSLTTNQFSAIKPFDLMNLRWATVGRFPFFKPTPPFLHRASPCRTVAVLSAPGLHAWPALLRSVPGGIRRRWHFRSCIQSCFTVHFYRAAKQPFFDVLRGDPH